MIQLVNKHPLGTRIKFVQYVKEWQKSIRGNALDNSAPRRLSGAISSNILSTGSAFTSSELAQSFNLENILSTNTQGAMIVSYYSLNNYLNESCRNLLVDLIIATLVDKKMSMTVTLANHIATTIVETFTSEIKVFYT